MKRIVCRCIVLCLAFAVLSHRANTQSALPYDALIQQGKTQLQAGSADQALATGEQAIKLDAKRWEGYALAGGALMNLKRYDQAIDRLTDAIERAPQGKQAGLRELRKQCILAESGSPSATPPTSAPASPAPPANSSAPEAAATQAEIVLWKSIEKSSDPADFKGYLNQYPNGAFAVLARQRLAATQAQAAQKDREERQEVIAQSTWTDASSSLMWAKVNTSDKTRLQGRNYGQAFNYCVTLRLAEFSDWRIPDLDELQSVYHKDAGWGGSKMGRTQMIEGQDNKAIFAYAQHLSRDEAFWTSSPGAEAGTHVTISNGRAHNSKDISGLNGVLCVRKVQGTTLTAGSTK